MLRKERGRNPVYKLELRKTVSTNRKQKCELFHPTVLLKQEHSKQNKMN